MLVLIKPWGLGLDWQQLSYASLTHHGDLDRRGACAPSASIWRRSARSIERRTSTPAEIRLDVADLRTIETLVEELADPDEARVLYAIDLLESLDKRHLITPLLLHHESPRVRARALGRCRRSGAGRRRRWLPASSGCSRRGRRRARRRRAGAGRHSGPGRGRLDARDYLSASDPRLVVTAATALAASPEPGDADAAEAALQAPAR